MAKPKPPRGRTGSVENFKIVLTGRQKDADVYLLTKTLAGELGIPLDEAKSMVSDAPTEIFSSLPEEAAELFAEKIHKVGGDVEVVPLRLGPFSLAYPHKRARGKCKETEAYICDREIIDAGGRLLSAEGFRIRRRRFFVRLVAIVGVLAGLLVLWTAVRPAVMRFYRHQNLEKGARVLVVCVANRPDMERVHLFNDIGQKKSAYSGNTFWDMADVFNREFARYVNSTDPFMTIDVIGLLETDKDNPIPTEPGIGFRDYFRRFTERYKLDLDQYTYVVLVDFVPFAELPFGDDIQNLSITSGSEAIVWFAADQADRRDHYLTGVMHALGKLMGGTLKQTVTGNPLYPSGYPDAGLAEFQSSEFAELMAGYRPDQLRSRAEVEDIAKIRIGPTSAWEFGWTTDKVRAPARVRAGSN